MPELPEVESVRRQLAPRLEGRRVVDVWWDPHPQQRFHDVGALPGHTIARLDRRGKYLIARLADAPDGVDRELLLHLGMTGSFSFDVRDQYARAVFDLDDGSTLTYRDPRRFGRVSLVEAGDHSVAPTLASLGPEPLGDDFTVAGFVEALKRSKAPVKAVLLGQKVVAGVGNIYADEALWRARIHPRSKRVGKERATALHAAIQEVIAAAIEREGTTFSDYQMVNGESGKYATFLVAYGKEGVPCTRCDTPMVKDVVAQRGTTWCPTCQRH